MPRFLNNFLATIAVVLFTASGVSAQDASSPVLQRIVKSQTLRVGMTGDQAPFNVVNRDGKIIGMDADIARLLSNSMGVQLEIVQMDFAKLLSALEDGKIDAVISGMTSTLQRNVRVPFVGPYFVAGMTILTKSEKLAMMNDAEEIDQSKIRVAALRGSTAEEFVEKILDNSTLTATLTHAESTEMLLTDKVDAVVTNSPNALLTIMRNPEAGLVTLKKPLTIEPISIALAPGDPLLINLVQNYMKALEATGALEALETKWFGNSDWMAQVP